MNATEMLAKLNAVECATAERKNNEMAKKKERCLSGLKKAAALSGKLQAIRPVVAKLLEMGIGYYDYNIWNEFLTDGVSHRWGFCKSDTSFFGAAAGGCDGMFNLFLNIDTGRWTLKGTNSDTMVAEEVAEMAARPYIHMGRVIYNDLFFVLEHANTMAEGIEAYIAKVEKAVAGLK